MAVGGALVMKAGGGSSAESPNFTLGVMVVALGSFTSACYYIIQKKSLSKYPPVSVTAWEYWVGFGFMLLAGLLFVEHTGRWALSPNAMIALLFSVFFNSVIKYALTAYCNKHVGAVILTVWATLVPVLTVTLSFIFLGTPLQWRYFGTVPIIAGTFLVTKGRAEAQRRREDAPDE
jgi:drug/metabolite transporter (DMT)-like permease